MGSMGRVCIGMYGVYGGGMVEIYEGVWGRYDRNIWGVGDAGHKSYMKPRLIDHRIPVSLFSQKRKPC